MWDRESISFYLQYYYQCMKDWMKDAVFLLYIVIVMPFASLLYFGYAFTNFETIFIIIGAAALWLVLIPYPVYWYLKNRVFI